MWKRLYVVELYPDIIRALKEKGFALTMNRELQSDVTSRFPSLPIENFQVQWTLVGRQRIIILNGALICRDESANPCLWITCGISFANRRNSLPQRGAGGRGWLTCREFRVTRCGNLAEKIHHRSWVFGYLGRLVSFLTIFEILLTNRGSSCNLIILVDVNEETKPK